ncbi:unnamed protein product [Dracunculus medinensis]|uniref:ShKT domain-containing protein n=1 Tax=Dracunculus medinensis TaxID=318479 RepID=A0A0N4U3H6_DRAME|nr:unnamed protein product [Dracunculus medinensis]
MLRVESFSNSLRRQAAGSGAPASNESPAKISAHATKTCEDRDYRCFDLVASGGEMSCSATSYTTKFCPKTCVLCGSMDKKAGGKAIFPTIPIFTYGEEIEISLPQPNMKGLKALNYSAFAWDINNQQELHSEYGYIAMNSRTNEVALTTVMNNG